MLKLSLRPSHYIDLTNLEDAYQPLVVRTSSTNVNSLQAPRQKRPLETERDTSLKRRRQDISYSLCRLGALPGMSTRFLLLG